MHGVDYYFLDNNSFKKMIEEDELLEWAEVYGHFYGTPRRFLQEALDRGNDVILEIDIQGALQVKDRFPMAVLIFVVPPPDLRWSPGASQGTDTREEIEKRLRCTEREIKMAWRYDYIVINDQLTRTLDTVRAIITAEKARPQRSQCLVRDLLR